jgi:hypothetical protein
MQLPNTEESLTCYAWMRFYFDMVGDCEPNSDGEIHLEPCSIIDIYLEYKQDQELNGSKYLCANKFSQMWLKCFP